MPVFISIPTESYATQLEVNQQVWSALCALFHQRLELGKSNPLIVLFSVGLGQTFQCTECDDISVQ